ncbi:Uncharacterized protein PBTT_03291 [Plasmodiophora brassicae]
MADVLVHDIDVGVGDGRDSMYHLLEGDPIDVLTSGPKAVLTEDVPVVVALLASVVFVALQCRATVVASDCVATSGTDLVKSAVVLLAWVAVAGALLSSVTSVVLSILRNAVAMLMVVPVLAGSVATTAGLVAVLDPSSFGNASASCPSGLVATWTAGSVGIVVTQLLSILVVLYRRHRLLRAPYDRFGQRRRDVAGAKRDLKRMALFVVGTGFFIGIPIAIESAVVAFVALA